MRRRQLPGEPEPPTKGELKRRAQSLQQLADRLVEAPDAVLDRLALPEALRDAVLLARRIGSRPALLRQKQYVAKLLRRIEVEPIRAALEAVASERQRETHRFRYVERWRERILAEGDAAVAALVSECPALDTADFRTLVAEARRSHAAGAAQRASRALFRALNRALPPA
jgi:ribosome-associated protein